MSVAYFSRGRPSSPPEGLAFPYACPKSEDGESMGLGDKCSQKKRFVLIAEDDEDDRMLYETALGEFAGSVEFKFVENGRELIDYLSSRDSFPDLIFLNINMPLMDGLETLTVMRSHPKFKDLPVVCLTTSSSQEDRNFCLDHGAGFYTKPIRMSEFSALVQSQIRTS
jgi:CheY-like chemotaxis protein